MDECRERTVPALLRHEEQAIFTYTKFLNTHQLNMEFSGIETELLTEICELHRESKCLVLLQDPKNAGV